MELAFSIIDFVLEPTHILYAVLAFCFITSIISLYLADRIQKNADIKNEFITIISHKFRTPLTSVRWNIEDLISKEQDPEKKKMFEDMRSSNQILISLTNTLIELTRTDKEAKDPSHTENVAVFDFVQGVVAPLQVSFAEKKISFSIICPEDNKKLQVRVDKSRLEFVLNALLKNAITYTPNEGKVELDIIKMGRNVEISVTDTGIGIEKEQIGDIFSEFHRAPNAVSFNTEGLGADLFLVRSIIGRLNGTIRAFSEGKDKGSKFTVSLPRA